MLSRLRLLPVNQFSKYITEQISRNCNTSVTSDLKFQPLNTLQGSEIFNSSVKKIKNVNLLRNFKTETVASKNSKNPFDRTKFSFFLKDIGVRNILNEVKKKKNNLVTPIIMREKHKDTPSTEINPLADIEAELYDVQHKMDPYYSEIIYLKISTPDVIVLENFNTSGPILWNLVE
ncbi:hypothetical protein HZH66_002416 [Vespula vulgaris]|uniref:Uncharacterized protein n=1 Tax=Vespula vulgaris TaxID=7454 RepID=A0A834KN40_VESVU|nr:uncharacterized protein LOC127072623 [Vespula vulgaris]KAF7407879.1 hypothetical protein HZH66_002416 [Vespula vulgaris]